MGRKGVMHVLVIIAAILLTEHGTKGQPAPPAMCPSSTVDRESICKTETGIDELNAALADGTADTSSLCDRPMSQYACASYENVPAATIAQIINCQSSVKNNDPAGLNLEPYLSTMFQQLNGATLWLVMDIVIKKVDSSTLSPVYKANMMGALLRFTIANNVYKSGEGAVVFQNWMSPYIDAIDMDSLDCMAALPLTCDNFGFLCNGLNFNYDKFALEKRNSVGLWMAGFIPAHSCQKGTPAETILSYLGSYRNDMSVDGIFLACGTQDLGNGESVLNSEQLAEYVKNRGFFSSVETAKPIMDVLKTKDLKFYVRFLKAIDKSIIGMAVVGDLFSSLMSKINLGNDASDDGCIQTVGEIIEGGLEFLYTGLTESSLGMIKPKDCSDFQKIYAGIDKVSPSLPEDVTTSVSSSRMEFLRKEAEKKGSACTYGVSSSQWIRMNLGNSSDSVSYMDMRLLFPAIDGYEAIDDLNQRQCFEFISYSGILTSETPSKPENIRLITQGWERKGLMYVKTCMEQLNSDFKSVVNSQVRYYLLEEGFRIFSPMFAQFTPTDWMDFVTKYLRLFLSSITAKQFDQLPSDKVEDCSSRDAIIEGLDNAYESMDEVSRTSCADWITGLLKTDKNNCIGNKGIGYTRRFSRYFTVSTILLVIPDFSLSSTKMSSLSGSQIGQAMAIEPEGLNNETLARNVVDELKSRPDAVGECAAFWDDLNMQIDKGFMISFGVKQIMLKGTLWIIGDTLSKSPVDVWKTWWLRIRRVQSGMTADIIDMIPDMDCDTYPSYVSASSACYDEADENVREANLDFMKEFTKSNMKCFEKETSTLKVLTVYFGNYSRNLTYGDMTSYVKKVNYEEPGFLDILSGPQMAELMIDSNAYESEENTMIITDHLKTRTLETMDSFMMELSKIAEEKNIQFTPSIARKVVKPYLVNKSSQLSTFSPSQMKRFFSLDIQIIVVNVDEETMDLVPAKSCDMLSAIVEPFDRKFSLMTDQTKGVVANWITSRLSTPSLNGCASTSETSAAWVDMNTRSFVAAMNLPTVKKLYPKFRSLSVLNRLSTDQKAECMFEEDVLTNITKAIWVVESLQEPDGDMELSTMFSFLGGFSTRYGQPNIEKMSEEVQMFMMYTFFTILTENMATLTPEQTEMIKPAFQYISPAMTMELAKKIPLTMSCNKYQAMFSTLSDAQPTFSKNVSMAISKRMDEYLQANSDGSSAVCSSLYTNSATYTRRIFYKFISAFQYSQVTMYNKDFHPYEEGVMDSLSSAQLGTLLMTTPALTNQLQAAQIMGQIQKREKTEVISFISECSRQAREMNMMTLPDAAVANLMADTVFGSMQPTTADDLSTIFSSMFSVIMGYITPAFLKRLPDVGDCMSTMNMVQSLDDVFDMLKDETRQAVYDKIKAFNIKQKMTTGSACPTDPPSGKVWLTKLYGHYSYFGAINEFQDQNADFSPAESLDVITGEQAAQYMVQAGLLRSEEETGNVFKSIDTVDKLQDILQGLIQLDLEGLKTSPAKSVMLSFALNLLSPVFLSFTPKDWSIWMQSNLKPLLDSMNETQAQAFPKMSCESYISALEGFNMVSISMTEDTRKMLYKTFVLPQLTGSRCGQENVGSQELFRTLFGFTSQYVSISDARKVIQNFNVEEVTGSLNPTQLGQAVALNMQKESLVCQAAERVKVFSPEQSYSFLESFNENRQSSKFQDIKSGLTLLSAVVSSIKPALVTYGSDDWDRLFTSLEALMPCMDGEQMTILLAPADCNGYTAAVKSASSLYDDYTDATKESLLGAFEGCQQKLATPSGVCPVSGERSEETAKRVYGKWIPDYRLISLAITVSFDSPEVLNLMAPEQIADYAATGGALADKSKYEAVANRVQNMDPDQTESFMSRLSDNVKEKNINLPDDVQSVFMKTCFENSMQQFLLWDDSQWNIHWTVYFQPFMRGITADQVSQLPDTMSCAALQSVIGGLTPHYNLLSEEVQNAVPPKVDSCLSAKSPVSGPPCPASSGGDGPWLEANYGPFGEIPSIANFLKVYPGFRFISAVSYLTVQQLGFCAANLAVLSDTSQMLMIFDVMNGDNIDDFMESLNVECDTAGIKNIPVPQGKTYLGEILCKKQAKIASFTDKDYTKMMGIIRLLFLSIDAKSFAFLPKEMTCEDLKAVMEPIKDLENSQNLDDKCNFVTDVLKTQKESSGNACTTGLTSRSWTMTYYGNTIQGASSEAFDLFPKYDVALCADLLSDTQLASLADFTDFGEFTSIWSSISERSEDGGITFLSEVSRKYSMGSDLPKQIKQNILIKIAEKQFPNIAVWDVATTTKLMNGLSFMCSGLNSTILEMFPTGMPCSNLKVVAGYCKGCYKELSDIQKTAVAGCIENILLQKIADEEPCSGDGDMNILQYFLDYIGPFCGAFTSEKLEALFPVKSLNPSVSLNVFCSAV